MGERVYLGRRELQKYIFCSMLVLNTCSVIIADCSWDYDGGKKGAERGADYVSENEGAEHIW